MSEMVSDQLTQHSHGKEFECGIREDDCCRNDTQHKKRNYSVNEYNNPRAWNWTGCECVHVVGIKLAPALRAAMLAEFPQIVFAVQAAHLTPQQREDHKEYKRNHD
jgi:hypothetical protein